MICVELREIGGCFELLHKLGELCMLFQFRAVEADCYKAKIKADIQGAFLNSKC